MGIYAVRGLGYVAPMPQNDELRVADAADVAELLIQVGRLASSVSGEAAVTPTQWMALRYFGRANRFSRTVSAFAEHHATTRGTVSQTIKTLTRRGYLSRVRSESDRRSVRLDLTEQGSAAIAPDPLTLLVDFIGGLPSAGWESLETQLRQLAAGLAQRFERPRVRPVSPLPVLASCRRRAGFSRKTSRRAISRESASTTALPSLLDFAVA